MNFSADTTNGSGSGETEKQKKCLIIKKKQIGTNIEKVEMRYVSYNRIEKGSKPTTIDYINDASLYLRDRANEIDYKSNAKNEEKMEGKKMSKDNNLTISSVEKEHQKLKMCIPVLLSIRTRFKEIESNKNSSNHNRCQSSTLRALCDEIIEEASYTLENGHPISMDLMKKIQNINVLSRHVLSNDYLSEVKLDNGELAASKSKTNGI